MCHTSITLAKNSLRSVEILHVKLHIIQFITPYIKLDIITAEWTYIMFQFLCYNVNFFSGNNTV